MMELNQKSKIIVLSGASGLLLVGVLFVFLLVRQNAIAQGSSTQDQPNSSTAVSSSAMLVAQGAPVSPVGSPMGGVAGSPAATTTPGLKSTVIVDPFAGGKGKIVKPVAGSHMPTSTVPYIPIISIPGVSVGGSANAGGTRRQTDNDFDFSAITPSTPSTPSQQLTVYAGRNIGWIANEGKGNVTAFFKEVDGTVRSVNVGSMLDGKRVQSIGKDHLILLDPATGREERVKLGSNDLALPKKMGY